MGRRHGTPVAARRLCCRTLGSRAPPALSICRQSRAPDVKIWLRPLPYQVSPLRAGFPNTAFGVSSSVHHRLLSSAAEGSQIGSHQHLCQRADPAEEGCPTTAQCRSTEARASCDSPSGVTLTDRPWWRPVGHSAGCRPQRSAPTDRRSGRCEVGRWPLARSGSSTAPEVTGAPNAPIPP